MVDWLEIIVLLEGLRKDREKTVIITTHDERTVQKADVIYQIDKGRLTREPRDGHEMGREVGFGPNFTSTYRQNSQNRPTAMRLESK